MNLTINKYDTLTVLLAEGTIEDKDLERLANELQNLPADAEKFILLDCTDLKKLIYNSIGFSGLVSCLLRFRSHHAKIILYGYDNMTHRLIQLLQLDQVFLFTQTLDEAYLQLNQTVRQAAGTDVNKK